MPTVSSARPYQVKSNPLLHRGEVTVVAGVATVDLGINHANFTPVLSIRGGATQAALAYSLNWAYGTKAGTFTLLLYKRDASYGAWVIATADVTVDFIVIAEASVV